MVDITIVIGVYKPTYNWGAPSCSLVDFVSGISAIYIFIFFPLKQQLNHEYLENIQSFSIENTWWNMKISGYPYFFICFPLEHLLIDEYHKNIQKLLHEFHEYTSWMAGWYQTLLVSLLPVHLHFWRLWVYIHWQHLHFLDYVPMFVGMAGRRFKLESAFYVGPTKSVLTGRITCNYIDRGISPCIMVNPDFQRLSLTFFRIKSTYSA